MPTVEKIYEYLNNMAPFERQESFDNAGFLVGRKDQEVSAILVALDLTPEVIQEARELGVQLIVTHHPVIFHAIKNVTNQDVLGRKLRALVACDISVICMHTNLDVSGGGVNDVLIKKMGVKRVEGIVRQTGSGGVYNTAYGLGRFGTLEEPMEPMAFAEMVKKNLDAKALRVCPGPNPVRKVAVCGGSGGDMLQEVIDLECDTYVTADVKYDQFLEAAAMGIKTVTWIKTGCVITCHGGPGAFGIVGSVE